MIISITSPLILLSPQVASSVGGLHLTADNIQYHATFIDSSVFIEGTEINVGSAIGTNDGRVLEVSNGPIA